MSSKIQSARTYNQNHVSRKYIPGKRRLSIYWSWSYPDECNRDLTIMENRFSTMTETRRVFWPEYETSEWDAIHFLQGIEGTLELFHRSTLRFQALAGEVTDNPVAIFQRIDQAGYMLPIDEEFWQTQTPDGFGLDHIISDQKLLQEVQQFVSGLSGNLSFDWTSS